MASTPEGRSWVIKALHPSDPISSVRGLPDESSSPSVVLSYYNVFRLSAPATQTTGSWGFDLTVMPNLLVPLCYQKLDAAGVVTGVGNYLNQSFCPPGVVAPSYLQCQAQWMAMGVEAHRLLGMGITAYQDGPALADQGTLTAAQWEVARRKLYPAHCVPVIGPGGQQAVASTRIGLFQENDFADYDQSQHLPNAYFSESKHGCYLPLRLTRTSQKWTSEADLEFFADPASPGVSIPGFGLDYKNIQLPFTTQGPFTPALPFPDLTKVSIDDYSTNANRGGLFGNVVYAPLNGIWGGISVRNVSYQTSFAFYIRQIIEARVSPTSLLAPQVQMSPPYDPTALASYFRINRELKDAYPADFNDLGKIWDVIKQALRVALPAVSMVPGPVGMVGMAGQGILSGIDLLTKASKQGNAGSRGRRGAGDQPAQAAVERARAQMARGAGTSRQKRKPQKSQPKRKKKGASTPSKSQLASAINVLLHQ